MNEELKFNLIKEEGKDLNDLIIEERGYVNKFTWQEFLEAERANLKQRRQLNAQIKLDQTAVDNILEHHAYIKDLTPEQVHAISLYNGYMEGLTACKKKLEEFEVADKADTERREMILAQIPELSQPELLDK